MMNKWIYKALNYRNEHFTRATIGYPLVFTSRHQLLCSFKLTNILNIFQYFIFQTTLCEDKWILVYKINEFIDDRVNNTEDKLESR